MGYARIRIALIRYIGARLRDGTLATRIAFGRPVRPPVRASDLPKIGRPGTQGAWWSGTRNRHCRTGQTSSPRTIKRLRPPPDRPVVAALRTRDNW